MADDDYEITADDLNSARSLDAMARVITGFMSNTATDTRMHLDKIREFMVEVNAVVDEAEFAVRRDIEWALNRDPQAKRLANTVTRPLRQAADHVDIAGRRINAVWRNLQAQLRGMRDKQTTGRRRTAYQHNK